MFYVFDNSLELAGLVESFEYLRWTRRYNRCGSFEVKAIATEENLALLVLGNILWLSTDEEAGIIEYVEMSRDEQEIITVSGQFATSYLSRRIIWNTETLNDTLSDCVGQLLQNHIINPSDADRKMDFLHYINDNITEPVSTQISFRNLMDAITGLCEASDVGVKTVFDPTAKTFTVRLYEGAVSQAVFAEEYENLTSQILTQSVVDYSNVALIGGEGEGVNRVFETTGSGAGVDRREIFVDAKDLRSEDFPGGYTAALLFRGQSKLSEHIMTQSFDSTFNPHGNLRYKIDFDLGQVVKVLSKRWGVTLETRITEIEETYDADGQSLDVVFGKGILTLPQKLKGVLE